MKKILMFALILLLAASVCFAGGSKEKKVINGIADLEGLKIGQQRRHDKHSRLYQAQEPFHMM